jgi:DNA-binding LacI/PurR family transcriptional regulator
MSDKPVTIRDVAQRVGVSESTVSRVVSGAETAIPISDETRERVLEAVQELAYRPHPGAQSLRGQSTRLLGLIVREIEDPFFAQLTEAIGNVAREKGYDLVLGYAKSDPEEALALSEMMLDLRYCDGLFLLGDLKESPKDHTFLARMGKSHRLVSVSRGSRQLVGNTPSVGVDNRKGALTALDYLAQLGHRRIGHINAERVGDLQERMEAYTDFMTERFAESRPEYIELDENTYEGGYQATRRLLSSPSPPSAIFATDDTMAIGALSAASDMGLVVPRDVSIVGFDDVAVAAYIRPALTTVRQSIEKIGEEAVKLLLDIVEQKSIPDPLPHLLLEPELVIRGSCGPPATQR